MAERDMTGRERSALDRPDDPARDLDPHAVMGGPATDDPDTGGLTADLARPRQELSGGIGRLGAPGGLGGDLANLPPWSARAERLRPERDPAALAAWRRVAERRRRRTDPDVDADLPASDLPASDGSARDGSASDGSARDVPEPAVPSPGENEPADTASAPLGVLGFGPPPTLPAPDADGEPDPAPAPEDVPAATEGTAGEPGPFGVHAPEPRDHDRASGPARPGRERPAAAPPPTRSAGPVDPERRDREGSGGRHEVLLALAGRLDDDALSSVRELVAVEDDAAAAELLGGSLLAAEVGLTPRELSVLGSWFAAARVDPGLVDALPRDPDADRRLDHRFVADPPATGSAPAGDDGPGRIIARAASRLPGVRHVRQCWRTTPAGASPGPVPHRVVLVETHSTEDCEHVAHHVAHAARDLGAVSVEVFATDAELPAYHRAAVASARPLGTAPAAPARPGPSSPASDGPAAGSPPAAPAPSGSLPVLPPRRRSATVVPPFGVPAGPSDGLFTAAGEAPFRPDVDGPPADDEFRTVADAGRDRMPGPDADADVPLSEPGSASAPAAEPYPEIAPAPLDPDPETTAERIAALWRRPVAEDVAAGETDGPMPPLGPSPVDRPRYRPADPDTGSWAPRPDPTGPPEPAPREPDRDEPDSDVPNSFEPDRYELPRSSDPYPGDPYPAAYVDSFVAPYGESDPERGLDGDVDPSAETGDLSLSDLGAADHRGVGTNGHHLGEEPPVETRDDDPGRVLRARHSRGGEPVEAPGPERATNGHRHAPEDGHADPATVPVTRPPERAPSGRRHRPDPEPTGPHAAAAGPAETTGPAPTVPAVGERPGRPSYDDSVDSQLSERERELLARLHDELASRERLEAGAPDPLLGRQPPGRPGPGPQPGPGPDGRPGPSNGHVNGHGLPAGDDPYREDG